MKRRNSLSTLLLSYMMFVLIISGVLTGTSYTALIFFGFLPGILLAHMGLPTLIILTAILLAWVLSLPMGRSKLKPVDDVISAMSKVSEGDFSVRVEQTNTPGAMGVLVNSFNDMAQELGSIEMFRKDFINNFSHEFKTPIVSIRGFAKQLERDDLTDEQRREYAHIIAVESERLANMSSNILLLTKLENQQIVTDKKEYPLDEQLRNCILLLEKQWSGKNMDLALDMDEVTYLGNEEMMSHIWVNLLGNAIKFSPEGATLEVACRCVDNATEVMIRDHGEGMDSETQKRIFEKFYQGDSSHSGEGNGLGLSLVKRIVDLCGGRITVESERGKGTAFTVVLPNETKREH